MKQSRVMSLVESVANVAVGYGVAVVTQILIFPIFGLHTTLAQNLIMGLAFSVVSVARSFALRRVFEAIRFGSMDQGSFRRSSPPSVMRTNPIAPLIIFENTPVVRGR